MGRPREDKTGFPCPHCTENVELVGSREATRLLRTNSSTWQSWRERPDFPKPVWNAGQGGLWHRDDLLRWKAERELQDAVMSPETTELVLRALDGGLDRR